VTVAAVPKSYKPYPMAAKEEAHELAQESSQKVKRDLFDDECNRELLNCLPEFNLEAYHLGQFCRFLWNGKVCVTRVLEHNPACQGPKLNKASPILRIVEREIDSICKPEIQIYRMFMNLVDCEKSIDDRNVEECRKFDNVTPEDVNNINCGNINEAITCVRKALDNPNQCDNLSLDIIHLFGDLLTSFAASCTALDFLKR